MAFPFFWAICLSIHFIDTFSIPFCDIWSVIHFILTETLQQQKFRIEIWTFSLQICFRNKFLTLGSGQTKNSQIRVFLVFLYCGMGGFCLLVELQRKGSAHILRSRLVFIIYLFLDKELELDGGGSVINGAYPVYF